MNRFIKWTQLARVKEIKGNELKTLIVILDYHNMKCDSKWKNTPQCVIQNELGLSRMGIYKVLKSLENKGFIHTYTNVYHSADDISPNIEYIDELINSNVSKSTAKNSKGNTYVNKSLHKEKLTTEVENETNNESVNKSLPTYVNKSLHKPNGTDSKELSYNNYNNSTCKKNENLNKNEINNNMNLNKGIVNENEINDSPINVSLTKTESNEAKDEGTSGLNSEGDNEQKKNVDSPYGYSPTATEQQTIQISIGDTTYIAEGKQLPMGTMPTSTATADDVIDEFDTLFIDGDNTSNAAANAPISAQNAIKATGEPISNEMEQLPTTNKKRAENALKPPYTRSNSKTDALTSEDIRKIQITDFKADYETTKAKLWNGAKFKNLVIAAVEHTNHLLFCSGKRLSVIACGAYLHSKATYLTSKAEMTEAQITRLHIALTELGKNLKYLGCGETLKTLQNGYDEFEYTQRLYRV